MTALSEAPTKDFILRFCLTHLKKSYDLPTRFVDVGNGLGDKFGVVGEEDIVLPGLRVYIPMLLEDAGNGYSSRSHSRALPEVFSRNMECTPPNTLESKACFDFIGSAWRRDAR